MRTARAGLLLAVACASSPGFDAPGGGAPSPPQTNVACSGAEASGALGQSQAALRVVDRALIGSPADYLPDTSLSAREPRLRESRRARRAVGWNIAARVVAPARLPSPLGPARLGGLRTWQTWHNADDVTRIFRRVYPELTPGERARRAPLGAEALDDAWAWNDAAVGDFEQWTQQRLEAYRGAVETAAQRAGIGGIYRVAYSPAASRHALESYGEVLACRASDARVEAAPDSAALEACGAPPTFQPSCLAGQFGRASVLVKANWQRLDAGTALTAYDTSAASLERKLASDGALRWGDGDHPAAPRDDEIFTLELPNGNRFGLTGLHIMTKELEHWVWVTLWWSDTPGEDFGADRPSDFPAPFNHYKLCTVVAFEEADPDPTGGAEDPSLAAALAATHSGAGGPTWCSNPYLERGDGNVSTNCIGCHQHAGTGLRSEDILADEGAFPDFSRGELRASFPSDYVFSLRTGDDLGAMFVETEEHYATP